MCRSNDPLCAMQASTNVLAACSSVASSAGESGAESGAKRASRSEPQLTGLLRPEPRGSQLTTSNRLVMPRGSCAET
jgi:hypothetical protein